MVDGGGGGPVSRGGGMAPVPTLRNSSSRFRCHAIVVGGGARPAKGGTGGTAPVPTFRSSSASGSAGTCWPRDCNKASAGIVACVGKEDGRKLGQLEEYRMFSSIGAFRGFEE